MNGASRIRCRGPVIGVFAALVCTTAVTQAQNQASGHLHATLRGWEDGARITIFDRNGNIYGRLSDRGILQRWNILEDEEYPLDIISFGFTHLEDYEWYTKRTGARWGGGSINYVNLVQTAEIAGTIPLAPTWDFDVIYNQEWTLQAQRSLTRVNFSKSMAAGNMTGFLTGWLKPHKEEMDLELGLTFTPGRSTVTVAAGALDLFSDFIYQVLGVDEKYASETLNTIKQPFTFRLAADIPFGRQFRSEVFGLIMSPADVILTQLADIPGNFRQNEHYGYSGILVEWTPSRNTAVGVLATNVEAGMNRCSLDQLPPIDTFNLTETTGRVGMYGMQRFSGAFLLDVQIARIRRIERRFCPGLPEAPQIDYEDRTWMGRGSVTYRASNGFRGELGLEFDTRDLIRDAALHGKHNDYFHSRLRFDVGWYVGDRAMFVFGANADLDPDTATGWFDGGHARFQVFW